MIDLFPVDCNYCMETFKESFNQAVSAAIFTYAIVFFMVGLLCGALIVAYIWNKELKKVKK